MVAKSGVQHGLAIKDVRDAVAVSDGQRILIDRLWPRGISKERAHLTEWLRELAPSNDLRKWFGHDPARWDEFRRRYHRELIERDQLSLVKELRARSTHRRVTLVFDAHDREHNDAVALLEIANNL